MQSTTHNLSFFSCFNILIEQACPNKQTSTLPDKAISRKHKFWSFQNSTNKISDSDILILQVTKISKILNLTHSPELTTLLLTPGMTEMTSWTGCHLIIGAIDGHTGEEVMGRGRGMEVGSTTGTGLEGMGDAGGIDGNFNLTIP